MSTNQCWPLFTLLLSFPSCSIYLQTMTSIYSFNLRSDTSTLSRWLSPLNATYDRGVAIPLASHVSPRSGNRIANLTFYDIKSAWTQAKNYALNVSEIEAKVNEATSDDPWGASSTLMQEIAAATNNFADFNEIMPAIFRNFMEREAREWRQIYKVSPSQHCRNYALCRLADNLLMYAPSPSPYNCSSTLSSMALKGS